MFRRRRFQPRLESLELRCLFAADLFPNWSLQGPISDPGSAADVFLIWRIDDSIARSI